MCDTCSWTPLQDPPSHSPSLSPFFLHSGLCHKSSAPGVIRRPPGTGRGGGGVPDTWHVTLVCRLTIWSSEISSGHLGEPCFWLEAGGAPLYRSLLSLFQHHLQQTTGTRALLTLTSALCLCFSSCWADFCLAFSILLTGSLILGFSLREGGSMT